LVRAFGTSVRDRVAANRACRRTLVSSPSVCALTVNGRRPPLPGGVSLVPDTRQDDTGGDRHSNDLLAGGTANEEHSQPVTPARRLKMTAPQAPETPPSSPGPERPAPPVGPDVVPPVGPDIVPPTTPGPDIPRPLEPDLPLPTPAPGPDIPPLTPPGPREMPPPVA